MNYKLVKEDDEAFHVEHEDGSTFRVAKKHIGPELHEQIRNFPKVQKLADGTDSSDGVQPQFEQIETDAPQESAPVASNGGLQIEPVTEAEARSPAGGAPQDVSLTDTGAQPTQPAEAQPQSQYDPYASQMQAQNKAIQDQQTINADLGKQQAAGYGQMAQNAKQLEQGLQANEQHYAPIEQGLQDKSNKLFDAVMSGKIDHNRVWSNMSTGNKILAGISVALSGLGSGLTGKSNMAMDVIQKTIDRDIESQQADLGKKQNLFSENLRQLGDIRAAKAATQAQLLGVTQAKANMVAAQMGNAQATAGLQIKNKELDLQRAQLNAQAAAFSAAQKGGSFDPSVLVPRLVPEAHQKESFSEIKRARDTRNSADAIYSGFEQAAKDTSGIGALTAGVKEPRSVLAFQQALMPTVSDVEGSVRQAVMDNLKKDLTPNQYDTKKDIETRRNALRAYVESKKAAPVSKGFGIDLDKFQSTAPKDTSPTKTVNGVTYKRGPNGEAIPI